MKKEQIWMAREFLVTQMNHWPLFALVVTILGIGYGGPPVLWAWMLCSLLPFVLFLFRRYSKHFWLLLLGHVICGVSVGLLPCGSVMQQVLLKLVVAGYLIRSFMIRIKTEHQREEGMYPAVSVSIIAASLLFMNYKGMPGMDSYYVGAALVSLGCFFLKHYLERYLNFLVVNDSSTGHIPAQEMFRSGLFLAILYSAFGMVFLGLTANVGWLSGIMGYVKKGFLWLLKKIFSGSAVEEEPQEFLPEIGDGLEDGMFPPQEEGEPFWFWVFLEKLILIALACAVAVGTVLLLRHLILFLIERFRRKAVLAAETPGDVVDVRERCETEKPAKSGTSFFPFLHPRERIRRIYKRRVQEGRGAILGNRSGGLEYLTARTCADRLNQELLGDIYEKARYSQEECTMEDVRALKEEL